MNDIIRTSKQSNAVLAGNAFVARFKREPVSPSDAAWLNGFVIALESNTSETGELLSIARDLSTMDCFWSASGHHEADCKCLSGRAERAVAAHTQKASEQRTTAEEWENAKAVMSGEMPLPPCECTLRDKAPSAYHNANCPRYVAGKL